MKKNMGSTDKVIRLIVAAMLLVLYFNGTVSGTLGVIFIVIAAVFTLTSVISFCPLYSIFGMNTCPVEKK